MTGEEVKKVRDSLGLTQREFADRCGVKVRTVQYWEANGVSGQQEIVIKSLLSDGAKFASYQSGSVHGPGSASVAGNGNNVNAGDALFRAFDEIAAQRRVTEKTQAQVDELIQIIKSFADGSASK